MASEELDNSLFNVSIRSGHQWKGPKTGVGGLFMKFIIFGLLRFFY